MPVLVATGVNADGRREIPGLQVTSAEDGAGRLAFLRDLVARGLPGVQLVISDCHAGLVATLVRTLFDQPDSASVRAQHAWVVQTLEAKHPVAATHLDAAREDLIAFAAFPREIWPQIWSNDPQEQDHAKIDSYTTSVDVTRAPAAE